MLSWYWWNYIYGYLFQEASIHLGLGQYKDIVNFFLIIYLVLMTIRKIYSYLFLISVSI